jgi:hypothetical protein
MRVRFLLLTIGALTLAACDAFISVRGVVKDGSGLMMEGAMAELKPSNGGVAAHERTAKDGSFQVGRTYGLGSGRFMLTVSRPGYKPHLVEIEPARAYTCEIILSADADATASSGGCRLSSSAAAPSSP